MDVDFDIFGGDGGGGADGSPDAQDPHASKKKKWGDAIEDAFDHATDGHDTSADGKSKKGFVERVSNWPMRPRMYFARGLGEAASIAAAPIADALVNEFAGEPYDRMKQRIFNKYVEPNLEKIDAWLENAKSLDPPHDREERHKLPRDEQAKRITDYLIDQFGLRMGASVIGQFATQDYFINKFNAAVPRKYNAVSVLLDRSVQLGSVVMLNTVASDQAIAAQNGIANVLKNAGIEKEKAEQWANFSVNFTLPNLAAYALSAEFLTQMAKRG
jgi:hypothetical protein